MQKFISELIVSIVFGVGSWQSLAGIFKSKMDGVE